MPVVEFAEKWPVLGRNEVACGWLRIWAGHGKYTPGRKFGGYERGENVDPGRRTLRVKAESTKKPEHLRRLPPARPALRPGHGPLTRDATPGRASFP